MCFRLFPDLKVNKICTVLLRVFLSERPGSRRRPARSRPPAASGEKPDKQINGGGIVKQIVLAQMGPTIVPNGWQIHFNLVAKGTQHDAKMIQLGSQEFYKSIPTSYQKPCQHHVSIIPKSL